MYFVCMLLYKFLPYLVKQVAGYLHVLNALEVMLSMSLYNNNPQEGYKV